MSELRDELISKIKILSDTVWDGRATNEELLLWLKNFKKSTTAKDCEQLHALYLLSQFMYFSSKEIRELLKCVYRDLFKYPIIERIRKSNNDTVNIAFINDKYSEELKYTRFLGVGNPSESGAHLLYYFRQENYLPKDIFISPHEIFDLETEAVNTLAKSEIKRYVFIDDFCGGGTQAVLYLKSLVSKIKEINPEIEVDYFVLIASIDGIQHISNNTKIDKCDAIFKLDDTYRTFGDCSRYKPSESLGLDWKLAKTFSKRYGQKLYSDHPLGHSDCQLMIGLFHNTPNNTLPIIWAENKCSNLTWEPIFRRYPKVYGGTR